jgi:hypothetical protein
LPDFSVSDYNDLGFIPVVNSRTFKAHYAAIRTGNTRDRFCRPTTTLAFSRFYQIDEKSFDLPSCFSGATDANLPHDRSVKGRNLWELVNGFMLTASVAQHWIRF